MRMKIAGILLVTVILLSYVPMISLDDCPGANHMGNIMKMDCGSLFHCPMIVDLNISETSGLSPNGRLVSTKPLLVLKELTHTIFHPPEHSNPNLNSQG